MQERLVGAGEAVDRILARRREIPARRALLAGLSGIDGAGKGYVGRLIARHCQLAGIRLALLNVDGWLNLPDVRFSEKDPAGCFYENALRLDEMFGKLVLPLREHRSIRLEYDHAEETATAFERRAIALDDVDVILVEGIYLLKRRFQPLFDLSVWLDCSFETALQRAIRRAQEGLPPAATVDAYRRIYFPAQEIHFERDDPAGAAAAILVNDPLLRGRGIDG